MSYNQRYVSRPAAIDGGLVSSGWFEGVTERCYGDGWFAVRFLKKRFYGYGSDGLQLDQS